MNKIKLLSTGGTIAGKGKDRFDFVNYKTGTLTIDEIMDQVSGLDDIVSISPKQLTNIASSNVNLDDWLYLKKEVEEAAFDDTIKGIVITHGTGTMEETAYFLNLTVNTKKPIVLVGAQRPLTTISSDAPLNLVHAILVANGEKSVGRGVLVVMNGKILDARNVSKTDSYQLETFQSNTSGYLGIIRPDYKIEYFMNTEKKHTHTSEFTSIDTTAIPDVSIIYSHAGASGKIIDLMVEHQLSKGIILAGTGGGHGSSEQVDSLLHAIENDMVVVRGTRCQQGIVVPAEKEKWYDFVMSNTLSPQKARILLMLALTKTTNQEEIQHYFDTH